MTLRIGTRGSPLALWQAEHVAEAVTRHSSVPPEIVTIQTSGDRLSRADLSEIGGKRLFVKEIEEALLDARIDLAVHSAKDLPAERLAGLAVEAVLPRENPRDAVVSRHPTTIGDGPDAARTILAPADRRPRVGTGSIRRTAQLRHAFPELDLAPVRGNVGTRLRKLDDGDFDLLVLAAAGLIRLGLEERIAVRLPVELCVPAPGQGIVVGEYRTDDTPTREVVDAIRDADAAIALEAERALVTALGADCQVPLGALATPDGDELRMRGVVASPDGRTLLVRDTRGTRSDASALGATVAQALLDDGAAPLLTAARTGSP